MSSLQFFSAGGSCEAMHESLDLKALDIFIGVGESGAGLERHEGPYGSRFSAKRGCCLSGET